MMLKELMNVRCCECKIEFERQAGNEKYCKVCKLERIKASRKRAYRRKKGLE